MSSPLSSFVTITFQATADTPPAALPLDGHVFYFPPEYVAGLGSGPTNPGVIQGVRGYLDNTDPANLKWVMTNELTATQRAQLDAIPGGLGWVDQAARTTYINAGRALRRDYAVPGPDILTLLDTLYDAAAANRNAQIAAGG